MNYPICGLPKDNVCDWKTNIATLKREWQGLTDEEISEIWGSHFSRGIEFAHAIEAKLKEKNT